MHMSNLLLIPLLSISFLVQQPSANDVAGPVKVSLCEMIDNPDLYSGRLVEVRATYRIVFENSALYCMECVAKGETWVRFAEDVRHTKRFDRGGTFDVIFIGVFRGSGHYGHQGAFNSEIEVQQVKRAKRLYKYGVVPAALPPKVQRKLCR